MDAVTPVPAPATSWSTATPPGSTERAALEARLKELAAEPLELP
jgi:1-pyrroline-5-carboxylate dehydrogenase